jgi:oxygen-independent coproporphyrinogen-3 oxidase
LAENGYIHYETSAGRRRPRVPPQFNYWRFGDIRHGAGAQQASFPDCVERSALRDPRNYLDEARGEPVQERKEIGRADLVFEFMMNALRLPGGFPVPLFFERTGLQISAAERPLAEAEARGLIVRDHERIRPTDLGQSFLNDLLQLFLPRAERA